MRRFRPKFPLVAVRPLTSVVGPTIMGPSQKHPSSRINHFNHLLLSSGQNSMDMRPFFRPLFSSSTPEWHHPAFMQDATTEEKEAWLEAAIENDSRIDAAAYLVVLKDLAEKSNQSGSPQKAEGWMHRLELKASAYPSSPHLQPTVECYNCVIKSWASSLEDASISLLRAERWLNKLRKEPLAESDKPIVVANTESYNAFLDICSKGRAGRRNAAINREHAQKAQETLNFMIEQQEILGPASPIVPNTESFNYVIRGWTRCRNEPSVASHVMDLLKQMTVYQRQDPHNSPVLPNTHSYTMVMDAFANAAGLKANYCEKHGSSEEKLDPSKNGTEEIEMVQDLLKYMHKLHETGGLDYVVPNTVTYNVLISGWARLSGPMHPKAPLRAEQVLRKMIALREELHPEVAPDTLSYTKIILAWTNVGKDNAGKRAQWWLQKLCEEYEVANDDRIRPTVGAYNAVMKAWFKMGKPVHAEMLLVDLLRHEAKETIPQLKPNSESFSIVIHAWLKADTKGFDNVSEDEGCRRAAKWLNELVRREENGNYGVTAASDLYDGVLKAASKCGNLGPDILDFSISILENYRASRHRVSFMAYVWLLQVGLNVLGTPEYDDTRCDFIHQLVKDCCEDGLLSKAFVRALANGPVYYDGWTRGESALLVEEFFPDWPLPWEWSRNLQDENNIPKRDDAKRTSTEIRMRGESLRRHV